MSKRCVKCRQLEDRKNSQGLGKLLRAGRPVRRGVWQRWDNGQNLEETEVGSQA